MVHRRNIKPSLIKEVMSLTGRNSVDVISFDEAVKKFDDYCLIQGLFGWTIHSYQKELKQIRNSLVQNHVELYDIKNLTTEDFEKFIVDQLAAGRSRNTINARLRVAKTFFNFCIRKKYLRQSPVDAIVALKVRHVVGATFTPFNTDSRTKQETNF